MCFWIVQYTFIGCLQWIAAFLTVVLSTGDLQTGLGQNLEWVEERWIGGIALHCEALQCTANHCTEMNCTVLNCTALRCTALHCTALHCNKLHWAAMHCTEWKGPEQNCTELLCTAFHWTAPNLSYSYNVCFFRETLLIYWGTLSI